MSEVPPCQRDTGIDAEELFGGMKQPEPYSADLSFERSLLDAASQGLAVREPAADELFIDIDSNEDWYVFCRQLDRVMGMIDVVSHTRTASKKGYPHAHVIVKLGRPLSSPLERILLQAVLGSDRTRELLSYMRVCAGHPHPTLFFEKI